MGGGIRSRGGKGEEEEHGAEPKVPTPDDGKGREGKGREFSSLDLPADSFSGFGLGAKSKWPLVNSPPFFMSLCPHSKL